MAQVTMYPANPGSPETTTSSETAIDATSIAITELGSLLAANNQCVLTDGTDFEVVVYTAKSAASGAGTITVTRSGTGHEGTAKVWPAGTAVYNSPTAYIFNTFKANIEDLDTSRQPNRNIVINGGFSVAQEGTAFTSASVPANSDDTYLLDQWILLSDGNDIVDVSQVAGAFSRSQFGLKAEVETANKKFGFLQILESSTCIPLRGQTISLSFAAKTAADKVINNVRVAVLEWTGTADAVTSDVVNAWSDQGTNPTLVANWAALNTAASLSLATTETTYKIEGLTVGASCNNLAVFIWIDDTDAAADDLLYLGEIQIVRGSVATPFVAKTYAEELRDSRYYFNRLNPASNNWVLFGFTMGHTSGTKFDAHLILPEPMRTIPTVSWSSLIVSKLDGTNYDVLTLAIVSTSSTAQTIQVAGTVASGLTQTTYFLVSKDSTGDIKLSARL